MASTEVPKSPEPGTKTQKSEKGSIKKSEKMKKLTKKTMQKLNEEFLSKDSIWTDCVKKKKIERLFRNYMQVENPDLNLRMTDKAKTILFGSIYSFMKKIINKSGSVRMATSRNAHRIRKGLNWVDVGLSYSFFKGSA